MKHWMFLIFMVTWTVTEARPIPIIYYGEHFEFKKAQCEISETEHSEKFVTEAKAEQRAMELKKNKSNHDITVWKLERTK